MLTWKHPVDIHKILGVCRNIGHDNKEAAELSIEKSKKFNRAFLRSNISPCQKRMGYSLYVEPAITFPFRAITLTVKGFNEIHRPLGTLILHSLHTHSNVR